MWGGGGLSSCALSIIHDLTSGKTEEVERLEGGEGDYVSEVFSFLCVFDPE